MKKQFGLLAVLGLTLVAFAAEQAGKTYKPDDEGFIRNWVVLDPIALGDTANNHDEDTQKPMFNKQYFDGQKDGMPQDGEKVKVDGKDATWHAHTASDYAIDPVRRKTRCRADRRQAFHAVFKRLLQLLPGRSRIRPDQSARLDVESPIHRGQCAQPSGNI